MRAEDAADLDVAFWDELNASGVALASADAELKKAQQRFEIDAVKYAAVRDALVARIRCDPYEYFKPGKTTPLHQRFRFIFMGVGDAIHQLLSSTDQPMTLFGIARALEEGGAPFNLRQINAALQQKRGVLAVPSDEPGGETRYTVTSDEGTSPFSMS